MIFDCRIAGSDKTLERQRAVRHKQRLVPSGEAWQRRRSDRASSAWRLTTTMIEPVFARSGSAISRASRSAGRRRESDGKRDRP